MQWLKSTFWQFTLLSLGMLSRECFADRSHYHYFCKGLLSSLITITSTRVYCHLLLPSFLQGFTVISHYHHFCKGLLSSLITIISARTSSHLFATISTSHIHCDHLSILVTGCQMWWAAEGSTSWPYFLSIWDIQLRALCLLQLC